MDTSGHLWYAAQAAIAAAGPDLKWFVLDALPLTQLDVTGFYELRYLAQTLRSQGAELVIAGRQPEMRDWRKAGGLSDSDPGVRHFPTLRQAVRAYQAMLAADRSHAGSTRDGQPTAGN